MRQWLVLYDITVYKELFLVFHIFLQFIDDVIHISFLYFTADFMQTRQIYLISFDLNVIDIDSGFEKRLEGVDLELIGSSISIHLFLSCFPVNDEISII